MERYQVSIRCDAKEALGHECLDMGYQGDRCGDPDAAQVSAMDGAIENGWLGLAASDLWLCPKCADEWREREGELERAGPGVPAAILPEDIKNPRAVLGHIRDFLNYVLAQEAGD